jgi:cytoskeletal protein CcmA (bactofilin family)
MGTRSAKRMEEYERRLAEDAIPTTTVSGFGRFNIPSLGEGQVAGMGRISPEKIIVSGSSQLPGGIRVGSVTTSGSSTIRGDLEASRIKFSGSTVIHGTLVFSQLEGSGSMRTGGSIRGDSMRFSGSCKIDGDVELEEGLIVYGSLSAKGNVALKGSADLDGSFDIEGKIEAETFGARLSRYRSHVDEGISADTIDIRKGSRFDRLPRLATMLLGRGRGEGELVTTDIHGRAEVYLENVTCDNVTGGDVTVGEGCEVRGRVRYTGSVEVHPNAVVHNPPETM